MVVAAARPGQAQVISEAGKPDPFGGRVIWMGHLQARQASLGQPGDDVIGDPRTPGRRTRMGQHRHSPGRPDQRDGAVEYLKSRGMQPAAEASYVPSDVDISAQVVALRQAVSLSDNKTPIDDLNSARWYLCYLLFDSGQYYDAAALGEFLARRYPDSLPARRAALIAAHGWGPPSILGGLHHRGIEPLPD